MEQKAFQLVLPTTGNLSRREFIDDERQLNGKNPQKVPQQKLLADLFKRQARRILQDITQCPPDTLPAHLARLEDWTAVVSHLLAHEWLETPEARLSGTQLCHPATLADWKAAAEITRRQHRAPVFANYQDGELGQINRKLDMLAGLVAGLLNVPTPEVFTNLQGKSERV